MTTEKITKSRRKFDRRPLAIFTQIPGINNRLMPTIDISRGGVRIYTEKKIPVGSCFQLQFFVSDCITFTPIVKVVWIHSAEENTYSEYEMGLEFIQISQVELDILMEI